MSRRSFAAQREQSMANIRQELHDLIWEAKNFGYWLKVKTGDEFYSPQELEALNRRDEKLWGVSNWVLIKPDEVEAHFADKVKLAQSALDAVRKRIYTAGVAR
jgi:hypothetical protein